MGIAPPIGKRKITQGPGQWQVRVTKRGYSGVATGCGRLAAALPKMLAYGMQSLIAFVARYLFMVIVLAEAIYLLAFHRRRWKELLIAAIAIGGLSFVLSLFLNGVVHDPRPFVVLGSTPLIPSSTDNGFPSDHTLLLSATAAVTMIGNPWAGAVGLLLAIAVGLARVSAGVHHMLDIVGSLFIVGFVTAGYLVSWMLVSKGKRKKG